MKNGSQGYSHHYLCRACEHSFSRYFGHDPRLLWIEHIDGVPFRKLGDEYGLSGKQAFVRVTRELAQLPSNDALTQTLCDPRRFSGILVMDGKYVAVKSFARKIPFLYGIDYLTHDIPFGALYTAEDEVSFSRFFHQVKQLGYDLQIVVADDRSGLKKALLKVFPSARLQLCHNHYLENIRVALRVRSEERYRPFFYALKESVFGEREDVTNAIRSFAASIKREKRLLKNIVSEIAYRQEELFNYLLLPGCPNNTNLIELYNSHLNGRLKTIKGFQSFASAQCWLNAWMIRRRTKPFTDCEAKFKYLNGYPSLSLSIKKQARWPETLVKLGVEAVKLFEKKRPTIN